jgi:lipopolysaccharide export system protein LptC
MDRLTTTYSATSHGTDPRGIDPRGFVASDRPANEVLFRRARRHSRRVRLLRVTIPLVLVVGVVATFLIVYFNPLRLLAELPRSVGALIASGTKLAMSEPKLSGFTSDRRRYDLSADSAQQDKVKVDITNLQEPRAALEMADGSTIKMRAASGQLDRKSGLLTLERDILVTSSNGYEARLSRAVVDMRNGTVVSDQPVEVKLIQATLQGNRMEVSKSGEVIRFDGGVTMDITPQNLELGPKKPVQP